MAEISVDDFTLTHTSNDQIEVAVRFTVKPSPTEERLQIPIHVNMRLMERDSERDQMHLFEDGWLTRPYTHDDDIAGGMVYVGNFTGHTTKNFSWRRRRLSLPTEEGNEEWYVAALARPDVFAGVAYSEEISLNLT